MVSLSSSSCWYKDLLFTQNMLKIPLNIIQKNFLKLIGFKYFCIEQQKKKKFLFYSIS